MRRQYDELTYRYPRTIMDAFGCDARTATAIEFHKIAPFARYKKRAKALFKWLAISVAAYLLLLSLMVKC